MFCHLPVLVWIVVANLPDRQSTPVTSPTQGEAQRKIVYERK